MGCENNGSYIAFKTILEKKNNICRFLAYTKDMLTSGNIDENEITFINESNYKLENIPQNKSFLVYNKSLKHKAKDILLKQLTKNKYQNYLKDIYYRSHFQWIADDLFNAPYYTFSMDVE